VRSCIHDDDTVHDDGLDADGKLMRIIVRRTVDDRRRIEDHEVRPIVLADQSTVDEPRAAAGPPVIFRMAVGSVSSPRSRV